MSQSGLPVSTHTWPSPWRHRCPAAPRILSQMAHHCQVHLPNTAFAIPCTFPWGSSAALSHRNLKISLGFHTAWLLLFGWRFTQLPSKPHMPTFILQYAADTLNTDQGLLRWASFQLLLKTSCVNKTVLKRKHTWAEIPQPLCFWGSQTWLVFSPLLWSTPTPPPGLLGIDGVEPRFALWALCLHHIGCGVCPLLLWSLCPHLSWTCGDPSPSYYGNTRVVFVSVPVVVLSRLPGMPFPLLFNYPNT